MSDQMRERVEKILLREVDRLENLSDVAGLTLDDLRSLDLLIKAHKTFVSTGKDTPAEKEQPTASVEELLADLEKNK